VRPEGQLIYGTTSYKEPDLLVYALEDLTQEEKAHLLQENLESADRLKLPLMESLVLHLAKRLPRLKSIFSLPRCGNEGPTMEARTQDRWESGP